MRSRSEVIEGTAREVMARLARIAPDERVRVLVGRPSLSVIARRTQAVAAERGMNEATHDALIRSLKNND